MIDTIILTIPNGCYTIFDHTKFNPSTKALFENQKTDYGSRSFLKYTQNPPKNELIYKPRLTIYKRPSRQGRDIPLKIELSLPKLLYGNNVDEVEEKDFDRIIAILKQRLSEMGVGVFENLLINAPISAVHFSKNILLKDYTTASLVIKELAKIELNEKLDLNRTHFRNEGHAIYFYADSYSVVLYDKWADITKPVGRAVDKEKTPRQLDLFKQYKSLKKSKEILKFEVRLTQKQKLKSVLKEVGFEEELTFKNIFNGLLVKKVIKYYWQKMIEDNAYILNLSAGQLDKTLMRILNNTHRPKKLKDSLALVGTLLYVNEHGVRNLKGIVEQYYSKRTWNRFRRHIKKYTLAKPPVFFIKQISEELERFKPLKTVELGIKPT